MVARLLIVPAVLALGAAGTVEAQAVCQGFDTKHTVTRWGTAEAISQQGASTVAELQAYFAANPDEIRRILASQGLGNDVADALLEVVRLGAGITERPVQRGETLQWMAYREDGRPATIADVCVKTRRAEPAFEIVVPVGGAAAAATQADCTLDVTAECVPGGDSMFRVRTASGATVSLQGPAGTSTVIAGDGVTWSGAIDDPYRSDYTFTVTNEAAATETATSYTFIVPKECINLALVDQRTEQRAAAAPVTCRETRSLTAPVCAAPAAACVIDVDTFETRRGEAVAYTVSGHWVDLDLEVQRDGALVTDPALVDERGTVVFPDRGTYTITGRAVNEVGATDVCSATVAVVGWDWVLRPFLAYLFVDDDRLQTQGTTALGTEFTTSYGYDDGYGVGLSLERLLSDSVGLELRGLYAQLEDEYHIDVCPTCEVDSSRRDYWDVSLGLNFHLTPNHRVDWYLGPFIGYSDVEGGDFTVADIRQVRDTDGGLTWGAQTGLDIPFGPRSPWSFHLGARYTDFSVDVEHEIEDGEVEIEEDLGSVDLNPITVELGLAYHF